MNFEEFAPYAETYWAAHPNQRKGQAYFNALHRWRPDIANEIRATPYDPFRNDGRLVDFLVQVQEKW